MSLRRGPSGGRLCASIVAASALLAVTPAAKGQSTSWKGTTSNSWSDSSNWTNGAPSGTTRIAFDVNSTGTLSTNNDLTLLTPNGITLGAVPSAGPILITGFGVTLGADGIDLVGAANGQALTFGITPTIGASQSWKLLTTAAGGTSQTVTFSGTIFGSSGNTVTFGVTNNSTGTASTGTFQMKASSNYTADTVLGGPNTTYSFGNNQPFGLGNINLNSFNTAPLLEVTSNATLNNNMTWNSGFVLKSTSTGNLILGGNMMFVGNTAGQVNRTIDNATASQTVTLNGTVTMSDPAIPGSLVKPFILNTNPGNIIVNGVVQDTATNTVAGTVTKQGTGTGGPQQHR